MAKFAEMESSINTIAKGTTIKGGITAVGDFRLDGTLEGNITLNGKLVVGESGFIKGNVVCQNANIIGGVEGNISVKELLSLNSTANVKGDIPTIGFISHYDTSPDCSGADIKAHIVNNYDEKQLADVLYLYGELKQSRRMAAAIIAQRKQKRISTTVNETDCAILILIT